MEKHSTGSKISTWIVLFLLFICKIQAQPVGFTDELVSEGFTQAVGFTFDARGRIYVWEKPGQIWVVENGVKNPTPLLDIQQEVRFDGDLGLLSVALDPDFLNNGYIYLYYVVDFYHLKYFGTPEYNPTLNNFQHASIGRVTRYTALASTDFTTIDPGSRKILVGETKETGIPCLHTSHMGGTLVFGTDGTLLLTTGDGATFNSEDVGNAPDSYHQSALAENIIQPSENIGAFRSQVLFSLNGKILRIDPSTGDGLPSNPYYEPANPRSPQSRIWARGLRNPYNLSHIPGTGSHNSEDGDPGTLVIGDVGWGKREELDICKTAGQNFGWPYYEGELTENYKYDIYKPSTHSLPNIAWRDVTPFAYINGVKRLINNTDIPGPYFQGGASMGGIVYQGNEFPEEYHNGIFFSDHIGRWIQCALFDPNYNLLEVKPFLTNAGFVTKLAMHPFLDELYYLTDFNQIKRIKYIGAGNRKPIAEIKAEPVFGLSPLQINFDASDSNDPDNDTLFYSWDFGDNTPVSTSINPTHTYSLPGNTPSAFIATLTVTDNNGGTDSKSIPIYLNNTPPDISNVSIDNLFSFPASENFPINLSATVSDAEHASGTLSYKWIVSLYHNEHHHDDAPVTTPTASVVLPPIGCLADASYWYKISLTVTDPLGLSSHYSHDIYPDCGRVPQSLTFHPISDKLPSQSPIVPIAGSTSGLTVKYYIVEGPAYVLSGKIYLTGQTGRVIVRATQEGNEHYNTAPPVERSFTVVNSFGPIGVDIEDPNASTPLNKPDLEVYYRITGNISQAQKAEIYLNNTLYGSDNSLSGKFLLPLLSPGTYTLKVKLKNVSSSIVAEDSLTIQQLAPGPRTLDLFTANNVVAFTTGNIEVYYTLNNLSVADQVRFSIDGAAFNTDVNRDGRLPLTNLSVGQHTLIARVTLPNGQAFNNPEANDTLTFTIEKATQTITFPAITNKLVVAPAFTLNAYSSAGLPITYSIVSGPASVSNDTLILNGQEGTVVVKASQAGNLSFYPASDQIQSFTVSLCEDYVLDKSLWSLLYVDSEEKVRGDTRAIKAFDNNPLTFWFTEWSGTTSPTHPHEIQIDLGSLYRVDGFTYLPRQDNVVLGTIKNYQLYISETPESWGTPVSSGVLNTSTNPYQEVSITFPQKLGRYARLIALSDIQGNPWTTAAELTFLGSRCELKQNQTITFEEIDEKDKTDLPFALNASASSGLPVLFRVISGPASITGNVLTLSGVSGLVVIEASQPGNLFYNPATKIVKTIIINENSCPASVNLALNKPAAQSSVYGFGAASRGVDGITDGSQGPWESGTIVHTTPQSQPWWEVDLGDIYNLSYTKIWNRTDCCQDRLSNFYVLVSDNPFQPKTLNELLLDPNVKNTFFEGQAPVEAIVNLNTTGRYIRIQLQSTSTGSILNFAEVEVIGCERDLRQAQVITFEPIADRYTTPPVVELIANASSGLPVSFSVVSGPATVAGNLVTLTGAAGTVVIQADQAGDANYKPAFPMVNSFNVVEQLFPTVTILNPLSQSVIQENFLEIVYTATVLNPNDSLQFLLNNQIVGIEQPDSSFLLANLAPGAYSLTLRLMNSNGIPYPEPSAIQTVSFSILEKPTIVITKPLSSEVIHGRIVTVNYTLSGDIQGEGVDHVYLTLDNNPFVMLHNLSGSYTFYNVGTGDHQIVAQLANIQHQILLNPSASDTVNFSSIDDLLDQTISFNLIPDKLTGDPAFKLIASASSGLPITFSVVSGPATLTNDTLQLNGQPGQVIIEAIQAGDTLYNPATFSRSFNVFEAGLPSLFVSNIAATGDTVYQDSVTIKYGIRTSQPGDQVRYTLAGRPAVIQNPEGKIFLDDLTSGLYTISIETVNNLGVPYTNPASKKTLTFYVSTPQIRITQPADGDTLFVPSISINYQIDGDLFASGGDHLHITVNNDPHITVFNLNGGYTFPNLSPGDYTIVLQLVNAQHRPLNYIGSADTVKVVLTKVPQTLIFNAVSDKYADDPAFDLIAGASSELPVTFSILSGPATLTGNTVSLTGLPGIVRILATQAGDNRFAPAISVERSFTVFPANCVTISNLALGKQATQSSTYGLGEASRAVDGNTNGAGGPWFGGTITHTNSEPQPWIQIDLGANYNIDTLKIWNRTDCCGERLANFYILVSADPIVSGNLNTARSQPGVQSIYYPGVAGVKTAVPTGKTGRYVRVQLSGTNILNLAEIQIMGCSGNNKADQSITLQDLEDKFTTDDPFSIVASASSGLPVTLRILSGPASIAGNTITLSGVTGTVQVEATQAGNEYINAAVPVIKSFNVTQANCTVTQNLALGKPATQSSTYGLGEASRAVNGNTNGAGGAWQNGTITHTNTEATPWWQVDLGAVYNLETIRIWNRTDCCGERLSNFHVLVSDVPFVSNNLTSTIAQQNVGNFFFAGQAGTQTNMNLYRTGRYVRIQLSGTNALNMAEVEIFGCSTNNKAEQSITFDPIGNKSTLDLPFTLVATASSGLPVSFSVVSGPATLSGNQLSLTGTAGTVVVKALQAGDNAFNAAPEVTQSFEVSAPLCPIGTQNLALGKTTSQSSTYGLGVSSRAVDNITDGSGGPWYNGTITHTNSEAQAWWSVDLAEVSNIETVTIWNRTDCCGDRLSNFYVLVSDVPFTSTSLSATLTQSGVGSYFYSGSAGTTLTIPVSRSGRYIRIQLSGTNVLNMAEVIVTGCSQCVPSPINTAAWTVQSVSSQETAAFNGSASRAYDGNNATFWYTRTTGGSTTYPHELQLNLGATINVAGFTYLPRQDVNSGNVKDYEFYVSMDGVNWGTATKTGTLSGATTQQTLYTTPKQGNYIRFRALSEINGNPWASIAEIGILDGDCSPGQTGGGSRYASRSLTDASTFNATSHPDGLTMLAFPNPFEAQLNLEITHADKEQVAKIEIFNMLGQRVFTSDGKIKSHILKTTIDLRHFIPGSYRVQVRVGENILSELVTKLPD